MCNEHNTTTSKHKLTLDLAKSVRTNLELAKTRMKGSALDC